MVNQKPISLKVDIDKLDRLDNFIKDDIHCTTRNREINRAIEFYLEYRIARYYYNMGETEKMREFVHKRFSKKECELFL